MSSYSLEKDSQWGRFVQMHSLVISHRLTFIQGLILGMLESQVLYLLKMERNNDWNQDYRTSFSKFTA